MGQTSGYSDKRNNLSEHRLLIRAAVPKLENPSPFPLPIATVFSRLSMSEERPRSSTVSLEASLCGVNSNPGPMVAVLDSAMMDPDYDDYREPCWKHQDGIEACGCRG